VQRRRFLKAVLAGVLLVAAGIRSRFVAASQRSVFLHGVASGDPTADSIILWTRVSVDSPRAVEVNWCMAEDREMTRIVASGRTRTDASKDFTVKVDADGLPAGTTLFYQFAVAAERSAVGRTRTLPTGPVDIAKLAVVSCANHPAGFFNVYREIAGRPDLDAVVHLGDYIYEYEFNGYASENAEALGRIPDPVTELRTLLDYRLRHAQYKRDPDSQAMLASLPLIAVWDDHEIANNTWRKGAEGHQEDDGKWNTRRNAAIQAYFEWMPIRGKPRGSRTRIFREFRYGDLASLIMLDTRLYGRDRQPHAGPDVNEESIKLALDDPRRRMLGRAQERWLRRRLKNASDTTWQVLGQQVLVTELISANLEPLVDPNGPSSVSKELLQSIIERSKGNTPSVLDAWDGYPLARADLYVDLGRYATNPVVLSGDFHTNLAADLIPKNADQPVAVEFMTGTVSSPVLADVFPEYVPNSVRDATLEQNPSVKYLDTKHRGWLCLTLTKERCSGDWYLIDNILSRDFKGWRDKTLTVRAGEVGKGLQA
jgi:alkaline phosphatase D